MTTTDEQVQTFRIEIRTDFTGTLTQAREAAASMAATIEGEVTDIADENWNSVT